jgi:signal transduction histidine kinase
VVVQFRVAGTQEVRWSHVRAYPVLDGEEKLSRVINVFRDVTSERRAIEQRAFLARAVERFNASLDYNGTLKTIAREMVPTLADWCAVDLLEGEDIRRLAVAHVDPTKVELVEEIARRYPPDPAAPGSPRSVLRSQRPYLLPVIPLEMLRAAARSADHLEMIDRLRLHSAMVVPILGRQGPLGTLTLATAESRREYSDADVAFLSAFADRAAVAIENAKLVRALEATVRREQAERAEAEKAARFSEMFIGMVSHDLRNPLNSVAVAAQLILRTAADERQRRPAARIVSSSERMARMIDQLLDFTRIRLGKGLAIQPAATDLGDLARQIADETAAAHDRPIDVRQRGDTGGLWDPDRLSQVLSNLLANAAAHGPEDKRLTLELDAEDAEHVHVRVSNDGQIDAALLDKLFEPFHGSSKPRRGMAQGLGLGLYITREIVEAHGGRIAVTSNDGRTTFRIDLPRRVSRVMQETG